MVQNFFLIHVLSDHTTGKSFLLLILECIADYIKWIKVCGIYFRNCKHLLILLKQLPPIVRQWVKWLLDHRYHIHIKNVVFQGELGIGSVGIPHQGQWYEFIKSINDIQLVPFYLQVRAEFLCAQHAKYALYTFNYVHSRATIT